MKKFFLLLITLCISVNLMFSEEYDSLTVAQALEIGQTLAESEKTETTYVITGYVSAVDTEFGDNKRQTFWLADTEDSNASSNADGAIMVYNGKTSIEIRKGYKVCVTAQIQHYKNATIDAIETYNGIVTTILEASITGTCGENLVWSLNVIDSILTISGSGDMTNYSTYSQVPWYNNWRTINSIMLSDSITSIGDYAFYGCRGLTSVTIPNSVTSIGSSAFHGCTGLNLVSLGDSVTSIGNYAFSRCYSLTSIDIPNSVTYIGENAFNNCDSLTSVVWNVKKCTNNSYSNLFPNSVTSFIIGDEVTNIPPYLCYGLSLLTSINIPNSVTSIGDMAFSGCSGLTSVTIPNSVTSIGDMAFAYCSGLTSVTISNSVTSIRDYAFSYCSGLTSVTIPNSVTSIRDYAFSYCSGLSSVSIPNSVTYIGDNAFSGCNNITSVVWDAINSNSWNFGSQVTSFTFGENVEVIPAYLCAGMNQLTSIVIPSNVDSIGGNAFYGCNALTSVIISNLAAWCNIYFADSYANPLTNAHNLYLNGELITDLVIPDAVTNIKPYAFYNDLNLNSITISESLTNIGECAFSGCDNVTSVVWDAINSNSWNFGSQVTSFTFGENVEVIPASLCSGMNLLTELTIPNSVTSIGGSAFNGCAGLTSMTIPNSVTSIGNYAFQNCIGLTSIELPNSVTTIGNGIISGCTGLTSVTIPGSATNNQTTIAQNTANLKAVNAPASFFAVQESLWINCPKYLEQVTVNSGELNDNALGVISRSYKTLKQLDIAAVANTSLADEAVKGYYNMTSFALPENLEMIGYMSVAECVKLQSIDIPAGVTEINDRAFENCRSLKTITFGGSANPAPERHNAPMASASQLERIGNWAFYNCHELQNLEIPEGVTEIGDGAFYGCVYLENLTLPSSVQAIGDNCFALCAKLEKIVVNAPVPPTIQAKTFYDVARQIPVYVPDECVSAYENDALWGEFNIQGASRMPSAIEDVQNDNAPCTKILRDGQVLIQRGEKVYTLQGQEVR